MIVHHSMLEWQVLLSGGDAAAAALWHSEPVLTLEAHLNRILKLVLNPEAESWYRRYYFLAGTLLPLRWQVEYFQTIYLQKAYAHDRELMRERKAKAAAASGTKEAARLKKAQ
jgi:hypothetical protein